MSRWSGSSSTYLRCWCSGSSLRRSFAGDCSGWRLPDSVTADTGWTDRHRVPILRYVYQGSDGMGAWGAIIMGFFGSAFAALTLAWQFRLTGAVLAAPFLVFAGI